MFKNLLYYFYEKLIIIFVVLLICISFSYQVLLNNKVISNSVGSNYNNSNKSTVSSSDISKDIIYFRINNHNKFYKTQILINGEVVSDFKYSDEIAISVYNNDIIDINGSMYFEKVVVSIYYTSNNIASPNNNHEIIINNNMVTVGKVKLN